MLIYTTFIYMIDNEVQVPAFLALWWHHRLYSCSLHQPPSLLRLPRFLPLHPLHRPFVPLSSPPGIFRYWSPHYSSIQPQQTHKQISCLRRSQSPSPSLLRCAIRPQHTPVRWARGKAYCRLQPPRAPPPNLSASQPCVTAAPNTIKSHLQNVQA